MELETTIYLDMGKKKEKVKGYVFFNEILNRELALHVDPDFHDHSAISDVVTGCRLASIHIPCREVSESDILNSVEKFIKHFTLDAIKAKFSEVESKQKKVK